MHAPVMGTDAHVVVVGDPRLELWALDRLATMERKWTRFAATSELSRLNAAAGRAVVVSRDTWQVVDRAVSAWRLTGGLFDPSILPALEHAGYDRSFELLRARSDVSSDDAVPVVPGCAGIELWAESSAVRLPPGVALDLGGVGKGWAADVVVAELMALGADGACVNVGGDIRVEGEPPTASGWVVGVEDAFDPERECGVLRLSSGAVVTSSRVRRSWARGDARLHHLIDPRTGAPAGSDVAAVTVVAAEAWVGEALSKAIFLVGPDHSAALLEQLGGSAGFTMQEGSFVQANGFERYAA